MNDAPPKLIQPRFFWRRMLALFIDWTLVSLLSTLLLLPFLRPDENGLRLGNATLSFSSCRNVASVTQELADLVAPEVIAKATLCEMRPFGIYNGKTIKLVYALNETSSANVTTSTFKTITVPIGGDDQIVRAFVPQSVLVPLLLLIASAMFIARTGWTPGKRVAGLRVQGEGCAICRELRRLGVFVVFGLGALVLSMAPMLPAEILAAAPAWMFVAGGIAILAVFGALYVWPMIRWRGAMPYDRATGFEVVRAG